MRQEGLVGQFLSPLLAKVARADDQKLAAALRPTLGKYNPRLNGISDLISQNRPPRKRRPKRKERGLHLVRIEINLGKVAQ